MVSSVQDLFDDPWSPLLAKSYTGASKIVGDALQDGPTNAMQGIVASASTQKPAGLRYSQLVAHSDYAKKVKCEIGASEAELMVFSVALDGNLKMSAIRPEGGPMALLQSYNAKSSLYSLAVSRMNDSWLVATGDTNGLIRLYDSREDAKHIDKLKGHSDIVKALLFPRHNEHMLVSGSSDGSIRIWDLKMRKPVQSLALHDDSVWALADVPHSATLASSTSSTSSLLEFYSGGRDGAVYQTSLNSAHHAETKLLFQEEHPILSVAPIEHSDTQALWVSTTDPCITRWELSTMPSAESHSRASLVLTASSLSSSVGLSLSPGIGNILEVAQAPSEPLFTKQQAVSKTPRRAALTSHHILPDKHRVLTRDSLGRALVWNIVDLKVESDLGIVDSLESVIPAVTEKRFLPSWFTAETRTGQLTIHIDPFPRCTESIFYPPSELATKEKEADRRLDSAAANALKTIFKRYLTERHALARFEKDDIPHKPANGTTSSSKSASTSSAPISPRASAQNGGSATPPLDIIVTIMRDTSVVLREHASNIGVDHHVPDWVWTACTAEYKRPTSSTNANPMKDSISFYFHPRLPGAYSLRKEAFVMHRSFTVQAMAEYLVTRLEKELPSIEGERSHKDIIITVEGVELPPTMDLGTIKHFFWKGPNASSDSLPLQYEYPN